MATPAGTRAKKPTKNVKSPRPSGNEGHRDEDELLAARAEAYRLHDLEDMSFRDIAERQGTAASTVQADVEWYRRYLQNEVPATFEAWRTKLNSLYQSQYRMAEALANNADSSFVQAQALKQMVEITGKMADLYGVPKAIEAPKRAEEPADDQIEWDE